MTRTSNLGLFKPGEEDLFGLEALNQNADIIDEAFASASHKSGDIVKYNEYATLPEGWVPCDGREIDADIFGDVVSALDDIYSLSTQESSIGMYTATTATTAAGTTTAGTTAGTTAATAAAGTTAAAAGTTAAAAGTTAAAAAAISNTGIMVVADKAVSSISDDLFSINNEKKNLGEFAGTVTYVKETGKWIATSALYNCKQESLWIYHTTNPYGTWTAVDIGAIYAGSSTLQRIQLLSLTWDGTYYYLLCNSDSSPYSPIVVKLSSTFTRVSDVMIQISESPKPDKWLYVDGSYSAKSHRLCDTLYPSCEVGQYAIGLTSNKITHIVKITGTTFTQYKNLGIPSALEYWVEPRYSNAVYIPDFHGKPVIAVCATTAVAAKLPAYQKRIMLLDFATMKYLKTLSYPINIFGISSTYGTAIPTVLFPYKSGWVITTTDGSGKCVEGTKWLYLKELDDLSTATPFAIDQINFNNSTTDATGVGNCRPILFKYKNSIYMMLRYDKIGGQIRFAMNRLPNLPGYAIKLF